MKAIVVTTPGGYENLTIADMPEPVVEAGKVLINVAYAGCNWGDTQIRSGTYSHPVSYPVVLGYEVSGIVAKVGAGVENVTVGDRVAAIVSGGYSEKIVVPATSLIRLPAGISLEVGAAFPTQALTAYQMLFTICHVKKNDTVLIHAIGGGVGLYCTQIAVRLGAHVIGTVGTRGKEKYALEYGAEKVVVGSSEDFGTVVLEATQGKGADVAIDSLGGATLEKTFAAVRVLGHIVSIGEAQGTPSSNLRERLMMRSQTFTRLSLGKLDPTSRAWTDGIRYLLDAISEGWLRVPVRDVFEFRDVAQMHQLLESRQVSGKLLLQVDSLLR